MELSGGLDVLKRLWRRKFWLLIPVLAGAATALVAVKRIEPRYRANALVLVEAQKISTTIVKDAITTAVTERLRQIDQKLRQDRVLEPIVLELELYPELLAQDRLADAVSTARASMSVTEDRRRQAISISFTGTDRFLVAKAANRIADAVIAQNRELRRTQTNATSAFLEDRAAEASEKLLVMAEEIAQLKKKWDGRLLEQHPSNLRAIQEFERRLVTVEDRLENAETRRLLLLRANAEQSTNPALTPAGSSKLDELRLELKRLRSRYTEKHPDVIRLSHEIAVLEELATAEPKASLPSEPTVRRDPVLEAELEAIDLEIARRRSERAELLNQIATYRQRLQGAPQHVQRELDSLESQYKNYEAFYRSLLKQQVQLGLAGNLEEQEQSEQFSILRKAQPPSKPYSPNIMLFLMAGVSLGAALGLGLVFLREETDQTFLDPDSLKEAFPGVPVLSVIPHLDGEHEISRLRGRKKSA